MIRIRDVVMIRHVLDNTESLLQALRELIRRGFHRSAVQRIADILGFSPLRALVIELLHNLQRKLLALGVRMRYAQHSHAHLIQAGITEADG